MMLLANLQYRRYFGRIGNLLIPLILGGQHTIRIRQQHHDRMLLANSREGGAPGKG